jgi:hypothetical protein
LSVKKFALASLGASKLGAQKLKEGLTQKNCHQKMEAKRNYLALGMCGRFQAQSLDSHRRAKSIFYAFELQLLASKVGSQLLQKKLNLACIRAFELGA